MINGKVITKIDVGYGILWYARWITLLQERYVLSCMVQKPIFHVLWHSNKQRLWFDRTSRIRLQEQYGPKLLNLMLRHLFLEKHLPIANFTTSIPFDRSFSQPVRVNGAHLVQANDSVRFAHPDLKSFIDVRRWYITLFVSLLNFSADLERR